MHALPRVHSTDYVPPPPSERPRERLMMLGREALSDIELVALVLGGGYAFQRAFRLLGSVGGLLGLDRALPQELCMVSGVGVAGASAVCGALELGRRVGRLRLPDAAPLRTPGDVAAYVQLSFGPQEQEHFAVLGLDARLRVRLVQRVAMGSLSQVDVHPREVFRPLIRSAMHAVILVHNHPSGDPSPSDADIELTLRLVEVGRLVGIPVLDHLVVTRDECVSLAALGMVPAT